MKKLRAVYSRFPPSLPLPMVLDGASGTELMKRGMPRGSCTELWVLENPDAIIDIHAKYAAAGSDAVCAPTFGANLPSLERHSISESEADLINERLIKITQNAETLIIGDLSPTGLFLEPFGDASFDYIADVYAKQAAALDKAGADLFLSETNISLAEARSAVTGIKSVSKKPVFVSLTIDENGRTLSGDTLEAAFLTVSDLGVAAFGANCSVGPSELIAALSPLVPLSMALGIPLLAKPNAGMPKKNPDGSEGFDLSPPEMAAFAPDIFDAGILIAGGCCGSDSVFIASLRDAADAYTDKLPYEKELPDTGNMAATNRYVANVDIRELACTEPHNISEELCNEDGEYLYLRLDSIADADELLEFAYTLPPLVLTGDAEAIEYFRRYYNGRALVIH